MATRPFRYDITEPVGQVRFYAGDTDPAGLSAQGGDRTRTDAEITFLLQRNEADVRAAAAELLEARAGEYAQQATVSDQGIAVKDLTQRSSKCLEVAKVLRANLGVPVGSSSPADIAFRPASNGDPGTMDRW